MKKFNRTETKQRAKGLIKENIFNLLLANIIVYLLTVAANGLPGFGQILSIALLVLNIGLSYFYLNFLDKGTIDYMNLFVSIKSKDMNAYFNHLGTMLAKYILIFLWSLLFIIPGIIKAIAYSQVTYIKAENPDMEIMECLKESEKLMKGRKMEFFLLQLSFIGWYLLCGITFGLALIYVAPYHSVTMTLYYRELCPLNEVIIEDIKDTK